mmetsp:Transcript_83544/g.179129  ORF Transcript_83544/g.179129 Transcript_83544/m.179129 type:complete len:215 (+) Transcript_83544:1302-1946(+)
MGYFQDTEIQSSPLTLPSLMALSLSSREGPFSASLLKLAVSKGKIISVGLALKLERGGNHASPKNSFWPRVLESQTSKSTDCRTRTSSSNCCCSSSSSGSMTSTSREIGHLARAVRSLEPKRRTVSPKRGLLRKHDTNSSLVIWVCGHMVGNSSITSGPMMSPCAATGTMAVHRSPSEPRTKRIQRTFSWPGKGSCTCMSTVKFTASPRLVALM